MRITVEKKMEIEISQLDFEKLTESDKKKYYKVHQCNIQYDVNSKQNWVDSTEREYYRHNIPYRRIVYRLHKLTRPAR